jgi:biotin carboxylase
MAKKILILNGSRSEVPLILAAKRLGYFVLTTGNNPSLIGHSFSDSYVYADYSDKEAILGLAKSENVDYICSSSNDFGIITSSYVSEQLGLNGHDSYETTLIIHHKDKFKKFAERNNIPTPKAFGFSNIHSAREFAERHSGKVIIKPIDLGGGKGISVATSRSEKLIAIEDAFLSSKSNNIVIEEFVEGQLHSVSTFILDQKVVAYYSCTEFPCINPFAVSLSIGPAFDIENTIGKIIHETEKLARLLNLCDGVVHLQYIQAVNSNPYIIEITRRCPGDLFNYPIERSLSFKWTEWQVRAECGLDVSDIPRNIKQIGNSGRYRIMAKSNGILKEIFVSSELRKHIFEELIWIKPGMEITRHAEEPLGIICFDFPSKETAMSVIGNIDLHVKVIFV